MAIPTYVASGTGHSVNSNGATTLTPGYPAGIAAGDFLLLMVKSAHGTINPTFTTPAGWTIMVGPTFSNNGVSKQWLLYKVADGTESGTLSISATSSGAGANWATIIHAFRGGTTFEGVAVVANAVSATITDADITTLGADRLCVNVAHQTRNEAIAVFTGMTGGTWVLRNQYNAAASSTGSSMMTADKASAGTVGGGSVNTGTNDRYVTQGFALIGTSPPAVGSVQTWWWD